MRVLTRGVIKSGVCLGVVLTRHPHVTSVHCRNMGGDRHRSLRTGLNLMGKDRVAPGLVSHTGVLVGGRFSRGNFGGTRIAVMRHSLTSGGSRISISIVVSGGRGIGIRGVAVSNGAILDSGGLGHIVGGAGRGGGLIGLFHAGGFVRRGCRRSGRRVVSGCGRLNCHSTRVIISDISPCSSHAISICVGVRRNSGCCLHGIA